MRRLRPQAIADAGLQTAGAAAALLGRGLADLHRRQTGHAAARVETRNPHQAAVHHDADALDGQAGLGDGGRQHDLALAGRGGGDGAVLRVGRQVAIERGDDGVGAEVGLVEQGLDAADLADAGQEDQGVAGLLAQGAADGGGDGVLDAGALGGRVEVAGLDGVGAALAGHHRGGAFGVREKGGDRGGVQRRRHDDKAQVVAQRPARLLHQGKGEVAVDAALVELVE